MQSSSIWRGCMLSYHKRMQLFMHSSRCSCQILITLELFQQIFEKFSNVKFHEGASIGSRVDPCGLTDITKFIVAFRSFWNAPKRYIYQHRSAWHMEGLRVCYARTVEIFSSQNEQIHVCYWLDVLAKLRKGLLASSWPSVCPLFHPHGTICLPLKGFS
jgi:hypothetical protein